VVFRRDNKADAFQRQISALRQQLGTDADEPNAEESASYARDHPDPTVAPPERPSAADQGDRNADFSFGGFGVTPAIDRSVVPTPPPLPAIPSPGADAQTSIIAHDAIWKGDLQTSGTIHVHGRLEGSISAEDDVYVAEEADVDATVTATNVVIAGLVRGAVRCTARFEVLPQGRVTGDIQAPILVIHEGAVVTGQFRMGAPETAQTDQPANPTPVVQRRAGRGG
jgi:cytoskeletal protein CcmA (bactofilin family)